MNFSPLISVVMPVFNAEDFLDEAIESILNQTFEEFEFIIIDDGSTDRSPEIIDKYMNLDDRIVLIRRENRGLVYSLNEGIAVAKGRYIARMDADDISLPSRFEEQVAILESKPEIDAVGCHYKHINRDSEVFKEIKVPVTQEEICLTLCYTVPFPHASVMVRKDVFKKLKYEEFPTEDYLLWSKLYNNRNFFNIDKYLLRYRHQYGASLSDTKRLKMIEAEKSVSVQYYAKNKDAIIETLIQKPKKNIFYFRSMVNIFLFSDKFTVIKILSQKPYMIPGFVKYIFRHWARVALWKLKT